MNRIEINLKKPQEVIESMIEDSENVYGLISEQLPELEDQAIIAINKSKKLLKKFKNNDTDPSKTFIHIVKNLDNKMKSIYEDLINQKDISELLNEIVSDDDDKVTFNTLLNLIDDLMEVINSLEQLSINAIIFSSRLEHGEAFRVISQEINYLSKQVKEDYNIFEKNVLVLQNWNKNFTKHLEDLTEIEDDIFNQYNNSLSKAINDIVESLEGISMLIKDFINQVEKSLKPIENLMIELQGQDLIRQNMENLNEIICTLDDSIQEFNSNNLTVEESLNTIQFIIDVGSLSKNLLRNVDEQFAISTNKILEHSIQIDELLEVINEDGKELWDYMVNGIKTDETITSSIDKNNERVIREVILFENKMREIIDRYSKLDTCDDILDRYLSEIKKDFGKVSNMANRFSRIKLLAKIEFAQLNRNDNAHIKNIEKIINTFIDFTKKNHDIFNHIEKTLVTDIMEFSGFREKIEGDLVTASKTIHQSKEELLTVKNSVKDTINQLVSITTDFYDDIHHIIKEFKNFGNMSSSIDTINAVLETLVCEAIMQKENLLDENGLDQWESTNNHYETIEEKFTSYIERKTASEAFILDSIDTGSEGGELTLF